MSNIEIGSLVEVGGLALVVDQEAGWRFLRETPEEYQWLSARNEKLNELSFLVRWMGPRPYSGSLSEAALQKLQDIRWAFVSKTRMSLVVNVDGIQEFLENSKASASLADKESLSYHDDLRLLDRYLKGMALDSNADAYARNYLKMLEQVLPLDRLGT